MLEVYKSGSKTLHSTDTALIRVFNDILMVNDSGDHVVLLDLTAAFDTVDHSIPSSLIVAPCRNLWQCSGLVLVR